MISQFFSNVQTDIGLGIRQFRLLYYTIFLRIWNFLFDALRLEFFNIFTMTMMTIMMMIFLYLRWLGWILKYWSGEVCVFYVYKYIIWLLLYLEWYMLKAWFEKIEWQILFLCISIEWMMVFGVFLCEQFYFVVIMGMMQSRRRQWLG